MEDNARGRQKPGHPLSQHRIELNRHWAVRLLSISMHCTVAFSLPLRVGRFHSKKLLDPLTI